MERVSSDISVHFRQSLNIGVKTYFDALLKNNANPKRVLKLMLERLMIKVYGMAEPDSRMSTRGPDLEAIVILSYLLHNWDKVMFRAIKDKNPYRRLPKRDSEWFERRRGRRG